MAMDVNKVVLIGRVTKDVELKTTDSGKYVTSFNIAVNKFQANADGDSADFFNCTAWNQTAEVLSRYAPKGKQICVIGRLATRKWQTQDGQNRYVTEVVVEQVQLLGSKDENSQGQQPQAQPQYNQGYNQQGYQQQGYGQANNQYNAPQGQYGAPQGQYNGYNNPQGYQQPNTQFGESMEIQNEDLPF